MWQTIGYMHIHMINLNWPVYSDGHTHTHVDTQIIPVDMTGPSWSKYVHTRMHGHMTLTDTMLVITL